MNRIYLCVFYLFLSILPFLNAEDFIENFGTKAHVNWTKGEVVATGSGILSGNTWTPQKKIDAHRAASLDAYRKLVEAINKINVDSDTKIENITLSNNKVRQKVEGVIRNFSEREVRFSNEGICEVDIFVPINGDGSIAEIFLGGVEIPKAEDFTTPSQEEKPAPSQPVALLKETPEQEEVPTAIEETEKPPAQVMLAKADTSSPQPLVKKTLVSGLVINTHEHPVRPALNPKIISENGEEVYGFKKANRDFRRLNGLVSYAASMEDACLDQRVIETPVVVQSLGSPEGKPCIVIISEEDAENFLKSRGSNRVLSHCRVIIVTKPTET